MPTKVHYAPRLGREGQLRSGCSAVIFNETRSKVLLIRRADNGRWCLPGGGVESGESVAEACEVGFFSSADMENLPMHARHDERVRDAFACLKEAIIKWRTGTDWPIRPLLPGK